MWWYYRCAVARTPRSDRRHSRRQTAAVGVSPRHSRSGESIEHQLIYRPFVWTPPFRLAIIMLTQTAPTSETTLLVSTVK